MRYYWLRDRQTQQQFDIYWKPGPESDADYFTKHHPTLHHRQTRPRYIRDVKTNLINSIKQHCDNVANNITSPYAAPQCTLRGCVNQPRTETLMTKIS